MIERHVVSLEHKHSALEALLASEAKRPAPDDALVRVLKRQKLRLKDEIAAKQRARSR